MKIIRTIDWKTQIRNSTKAVEERYERNREAEKEIDKDSVLEIVRNFAVSPKKR